MKASAQPQRHEETDAALDEPAERYADTREVERALASDAADLLADAHRRACFAGQPLGAIDGEDEARRGESARQEALAAEIEGPAVELAGQRAVEEGDIDQPGRRAAAVDEVCANEEVRVKHGSRRLGRGEPLYSNEIFDLLKVRIASDHCGVELLGKGSDKAIQVANTSRCCQSRSGKRESAVNVNYLDRRRFNGAKCPDGGIKAAAVLETVNHLAEVYNSHMQRAALLLSFSNESLHSGSAGLVLEKRH